MKSECTQQFIHITRWKLDDTQEEEEPMGAQFLISQLEQRKKQRIWLDALEWTFMLASDYDPLEKKSPKFKVNSDRNVDKIADCLAHKPEILSPPDLTFIFIK